MKTKWWLALERLEDNFDRLVFDEGGWKWVGGFILGTILGYFFR